MYRASGLGWLARFTELPVIKDVCDRMYVRFAHYRLQKAFKRCDSESDQCSIKLHHLREKMKESTWLLCSWRIFFDVIEILIQFKRWKCKIEITEGLLVLSYVMDYEMSLNGHIDALTGKLLCVMCTTIHKRLRWDLLRIQICEPWFIFNFLKIWLLGYESTNSGRAVKDLTAISLCVFQWSADLKNTAKYWRWYMHYRLIFR